MMVNKPEVEQGKMEEVEAKHREGGIGRVDGRGDGGNYRGRDIGRRRGCGGGIDSGG